MGERKGTNLYYPPDYDPRKGGINKFQGTHALRERARKIDQGILIIRFEMPFNIWCNGCGNHIGMGVRYNAEKKKIGNYYSTPIWSFQMKCHLCDNHFEIKTEPQTCEYIIVSGARRQENRWDSTQNEQIVPEDKNTSKLLHDNLMYKLEHETSDKKQGDSVKPVLAKLEEKQRRLWHDDYAANAALRKQFRVETSEKKLPKVKIVASEEERTEIKQKRVHNMYEALKKRCIREQGQRTSTSVVLKGVKKKKIHNEVAPTSHTDSTHVSTSVSLVSSDYGASNSDDSM